MPPETYYLQRPGEFTSVDAEGRPTADGDGLAAELVNMARSLEAPFGQLRQQMREYEQLWRLEAVRWSSGEDKELAKYFPGFPTNEPRVLCDRTIRANVKKPVGWRVTLQEEWDQQTREASQEFERYCTAIFSMSNRERYRLRLGYVQNTVVWFLTVRGGAIVVPFVRSSPRQKQADQYGDDAPFVIRTPDPLYCTWQDGAYGLTFFANQYERRAADFYGRPEMDGIRPGRTGLCDTWNVWWQDMDEHVWNATVVQDGANGRAFLVPPTDHTRTRGLSELPVYIDSAYGAPPEATLANSEEMSLAHQYEGTLHTNVDTYRVLNYVNALNMRLMKDSAMSALLVKDSKPHTNEELVQAFKGPGVFQVQPDGNVQRLDPPQLSNALVQWQAGLTRLASLGGMPDDSLEGVPDGMTGVAIQERQLRGDLKAGPISDALKRLFLGTAECVHRQHYRLRRKVKMMAQGANKQAFFGTYDASNLPAPGTFYLEALHDPALVRDDYRNAQTAMTWRNAGRAFVSVMDDYADDPQREDALRGEEQLDDLPMMRLINRAIDASRKYPEHPEIVKLLLSMAGMMMQQMAGQGQTNAPRVNQVTDAEAMPPPSGNRAPPASYGGEPPNPADMGDQQMLGSMGAAYGGAP